MQTPRKSFGFSLASRLGNALALSLQSRGLKTKNLLKQAWQIFLCSSLVAPGRFIVEPKVVKSNFFREDLGVFKVYFFKKLSPKITNYICLVVLAYKEL